jgi:hypothetical protein
MTDVPITRLSDSAVKTARDCKRKYLYSREMSLQRRGITAPALYYGKLWHGALAVWFATRDATEVSNHIRWQGAEQDVTERCLAMMAGYVAQWSEFPVCCLSEQEIEVPIRNPATGRKSRRFVQYGFTDMVALHDSGKLWLWEHKTTSQIDGNTIQKLWSDSQITGYVAALRDKGIHVEGVIYDLAQKPSIELGKSRPTHALEVDGGQYFVVEQKTQWAEFQGEKRWKKKDFSGRVYRVSEGAADQEASRKFYSRLRAWHLSDPAPYHREEVFISERQITDWREDIWQVTQELLSCRRTGYWYRNTGRCFDWHRACEYAALCQNGASEALINAEYEPRESPAENVTKQPIF